MSVLVTGATGFLGGYLVARLIETTDESVVCVVRGEDPQARVDRGLEPLLGDWDRSLVTNAPGQSGSPASAHFSDLAKPWAAGDYFPLVFSDRAIQANAESTLHLIRSRP